MCNSNIVRFFLEGGGLVINIFDVSPLAGSEPTLPSYHGTRKMMPSLVSVIREWTLIDPWIEAYLASLWPCRKRTAHVFDSLGSISPLGALSLRRSPFHWKGYEGIKGCITCYSSTQIHKLEASCRKQGPLHWQSKTSWTWVNAKSSYLYIYIHTHIQIIVYTHCIICIIIWSSCWF